MATFLYCTTYSYRSYNYYHSDNCLHILKAINKIKKKLNAERAKNFTFAIVGRAITIERKMKKFHTKNSQRRLRAITLQEAILEKLIIG